MRWSIGATLAAVLPFISWCVLAAAPPALTLEKIIGDMRGRGISNYSVTVDNDGTVYLLLEGGRIASFDQTGQYLKSLRSDSAWWPNTPYIMAVGRRVLKGTYQKDYPWVFAPERGGSAAGRFLRPSMAVADENGSVYVADSGNSRIQVFAAGDTLLPVAIVAMPAKPHVVAARLGRFVACSADQKLALYEKSDGKFVRKAELSVGGGVVAAGIGPNGETYVAFNRGWLKKYVISDDGMLQERAILAPSVNEQWPNFFPDHVPISTAPNGYLWFAASTYSKLLRLDPQNDKIDEFPSPLPRPATVAFGPDGMAYVGGYYDQKEQRMLVAGPAAELGKAGWGRTFPDGGAFAADQGACLGVLPDSDGGVYMRVIEQGYQKGWSALAFKKVFPDGKMEPFADYGSLYAVRRKFNSAPYSMAFDRDGTIVLAAMPLTAVLKMDRTGKTIWDAWIHPQGGADNIAFAGPTDLAIDGKGNIWVADEGSDKIFCLSSSGKLLLEFGGYGNVDVVDGSGFDHPTGIATAQVDGEEYLYVGDAGNHRLLKYRIIYGINENGQ